MGRPWSPDLSFKKKNLILSLNNKLEGNKWYEYFIKFRRFIPKIINADMEVGIRGLVLEQEKEQDTCRRHFIWSWGLRRWLWPGLPDMKAILLEVYNWCAREFSTVTCPHVPNIYILSPFNISMCIWRFIFNEDTQ